MKKLILLLFASLFIISCNQENAADKSIISQRGTLIDLTYNFDETTLYWPTAETFRHETVFYAINEQGYFYSSFNYSASEHGGTHIDAPIHFSQGGITIDEIPVKDFFGEGIVVNTSNKTVNNPDYLVSVQDFEDWEKANGRIPAGAVILLNTGWGKFYPDPEKFLGTKERGAEAVAKLHFPGLSPQAAEWLAVNRNIKIIGIDTPSIDYGQSTMFETHRILCSHNIFALEYVANIDKLPAKNFRVYVFPMKIKGGSGAPVRIVAEI